MEKRSFTTTGNDNSGSALTSSKVLMSQVEGVTMPSSRAISIVRYLSAAVSTATFGGTATRQMSVNSSRKSETGCRVQSVMGTIRSMEFCRTKWTIASTNSCTSPVDLGYTK